MLNEMTRFINEFVRPRLQADGGEIVVAGIDGDELRLTLMGECAVCPAQCGVREWVTSQVQQRFGAQVKVSFSVKKRYFQDK
jgi:Fe-S cluster biogenesis protein NfuA